MVRASQTIDVATGTDTDGNTVTREEAEWRLLHGWDMREVVCGSSPTTLTPGTDAEAKERYQIWLGPAEPVILLDEFLTGVKLAIKDGGDVSTLSLVCTLLTGYPLSYWFGEKDVPPVDSDMGQDSGPDDDIRPVSGEKVH